MVVYINKVYMAPPITAPRLLQTFPARARQNSNIKNSAAGFMFVDTAITAMTSQ